MPPTFLLVLAAIFLAYSGVVIVPLVILGAAVPRSRPYFVQSLRWELLVGAALDVLVVAGVFMSQTTIRDNVVAILASFSGGFSFAVLVLNGWKVLFNRRWRLPPNKALERSRYG